MPPYQEDGCISNCDFSSGNLFVIAVVLGLFFFFIWYQESENSPKNRSK